MSDVDMQYQYPITNVDFHMLEPGEPFDTCMRELIASIETFWRLDDVMQSRLGDLCAQMADGNGGAVMTSLEFYHVDSTYRDAYYTYYSRRHFEVPRWTMRLSFFDWRSYQTKIKNTADGGDGDNAFSIWDWTLVPTQTLQELYLGSTVICPTHVAHLGRTLLDPSRMMTRPEGSASSRAMVRLSTFVLNVAGKKLRIRAFPFHDQDQDIMSCAEVSILNLMKYYSNEFHGYAEIEPSDILGAELHNAHARLVPTTGLAYSDLCAVLQEFGFQPVLYEASDVSRRWEHTLPQGWAFRRLLHTYIESGIPVAVNVSPIDDSFTGHSLVCIGRTGVTKDFDVASKQGIVLDVCLREDPHTGETALLRSEVPCRIVHAADLQREYVVMDDNQLPYAVRDFESMSIHSNMRNARLVAPLKMGMTVEADDIQFVFEKLAREPAQGILHHAGRWLSEYARETNRSEVPVVMRPFLASSKRFKTYRVATVGRTCGPVRAQAYVSTPLPHYVWVCEFILKDEYDKFSHMDAMGAGQRSYDDNRIDDLQNLPKAFCEYVVDATAGPSNIGAVAVVMSHFPDSLSIRMPEELGDDLRSWPVMPSSADASLERFEGFPCYVENLDAVEFGGGEMGTKQ